MVTWLHPGGGEQTEEQWADQGSTTIGLRLTAASSSIKGMSDVLILFNPHDGVVEFSLPEGPEQGWVVKLTTADPAKESEEVGDAQTYELAPRSPVLLSTDA